MIFFDVIINTISTIVSITTLILVWIGLKTWKIQLKGENTFKLSIDVLRELKLTLFAISDYRVPFYYAGELNMAFSKHNNGKSPENYKEREFASKYAEVERWNEIVKQFQVYADSILKLSISINNYEVDLVENKRLKDYIREMELYRFEREINKNSRNWEGKEEAYNVLNKPCKKDDFYGKALNQYFEEINKRLRKYIK